jgi:hypothetical protein
MSEREIRSLLRLVLDNLDPRAKKVVRLVLPTMLGTSLALSGGCGAGRSVQIDAWFDPVTPVYSVPVAPPVDPKDMALKHRIRLDAVPGPDRLYLTRDCGPVDRSVDVEVDGGSTPPNTAPDAGE